MNKYFLKLSKKVIIAIIILLVTNCVLASSKALQIVQASDSSLSKELLFLEIQKLDLTKRLFLDVNELLLLQNKIYSKQKQRAKNEKLFRITIEMPGIIIDRKVDTNEFITFLEQRKAHLKNLYNQNINDDSLHK